MRDSVGDSEFEINADWKQKMAADCQGRLSPISPEDEALDPRIQVNIKLFNYLNK